MKRETVCLLCKSIYLTFCFVESLLKFYDVLLVLFKSSVPGKRFCYFLQLLFYLLIQLFQFVDALLYATEIFFGYKVLLLSCEVGYNQIVGFNGFVLFLLYLFGYVCVQFLTPDELFEQFIAFIFLGSKEVCKRSLGYKYGSQELFVVQTDDKRKSIPVVNLFCRYTIVDINLVERQSRIFKLFSFHANIPFCTV